jgi:hypothetical protein
MLMEVKDNVIWAKHLQSDAGLHAAVLNLKEDQKIRLSVDGIVGDWVKMRTGKDGRPVQGIKPSGAMVAVWDRLQKRRGEKVRIDRPDREPDPTLQLADLTFQEWYTAEDEEAFGELRPL